MNLTKELQIKIKIKNNKICLIYFIPYAKYTFVIIFIFKMTNVNLDKTTWPYFAGFILFLIYFVT